MCTLYGCYSGPVLPFLTRQPCSVAVGRNDGHDLVLIAGGMENGQSSDTAQMVDVTGMSYEVASMPVGVYSAVCASLFDGEGREAVYVAGGMTGQIEYSIFRSRLESLLSCLRYA